MAFLWQLVYPDWLNSHSDIQGFSIAVHETFELHLQRYSMRLYGMHSFLQTLCRA